LKKSKILIVDDELSIRTSLTRLLKEYDISAAKSGEEAIALAKKNKFDLAIVDMIMPGMNGIRAIRELKKINKLMVVIVLTAHGTIEGAVEAMKVGAYQYMTKPFDIKETLAIVQNALSLAAHEREVSKKVLEFSQNKKEIIWESEPMSRVFDIVNMVADTDSNVLITGESGTGKELIARTLHDSSERSEKRMIAVNCSAIPEELMESELFGHVKGAFTGAVAARVGRFELANGGTIFLDEIGDMSLSVQAKILRVLQERAFEPVGSSETKGVDVRVIAATNRDLEKAVENGSFREDLFYRLNVIPIKMPPLRTRGIDIEVLLNHFITKYNAKCKRNVTGIDDSAMNMLKNYPWPGNVRELENLVERFVTLKVEGQIIPSDLPDRYHSTYLNKKAAGDAKKYVISDDGVDFNELISDFENNLLIQALNRTNWNKKHAADLLGLNRTTLVEKVKKKQLSREI
jgi:DNA-binding NtrC family response regulator